MSYFIDDADQLYDSGSSLTEALNDIIGRPCVGECDAFFHLRRTLAQVDRLCLEPNAAPRHPAVIPGIGPEHIEERMWQTQPATSLHRSWPIPPAAPLARDTSAFARTAPPAQSCAVVKNKKQKAKVVNGPENWHQDEKEPRSNSDPDCSSVSVLKARVQELEKAVTCGICMEEQRNVVFKCGHSACTKCARNLTTCHMCRVTITERITMY